KQALEAELCASQARKLVKHNRSNVSDCPSLPVSFWNELDLVPCRVDRFMPPSVRLPHRVLHTYNATSACDHQAIADAGQYPQCLVRQQCKRNSHGQSRKYVADSCAANTSIISSNTSKTSDPYNSLERLGFPDNCRTAFRRRNTIS